MKKTPSYKSIKVQKKRMKRSSKRARQRRSQHLVHQHLVHQRRSPFGSTRSSSVRSSASSSALLSSAKTSQETSSTSRAASHKSIRSRASLTPLKAALFTALGLSSACQVSEPYQEDAASTGGVSVVVETDDMNTTTVRDMNTSRDMNTGGAEVSVDMDMIEVNTICVNPTPVLNTEGDSSGYVRCEQGITLKVDETQCSLPTELNLCNGTEMDFSCRSDAECTDGPNGRCLSYSYDNIGGKELYTACGCRYFCTQDSDCTSDYTCDCSTGSQGTCVRANCETGSDCETEACGVSSYNSGCGVVTRVGCFTSDDECRFASECEDTRQCALAYDDHWVCAFEDCAVGRPLLTEEGTLTASSTHRSDWLTSSQSSSTPDLDSYDPYGCSTLSDQARTQLAARWSQIAALEHSSIASFSRFTLQLMGVGAPADLILETQHAAADEVRHAQLAYKLASVYLGEEVGPGPLSLDQLKIDTDRLSVIKGLINEACFGETLGVAEVKEAATHAVNPEVRQILEEIAHDETRHAALAWRSLQWILNDTSEEERESVYDQVAALFIARAEDFFTKHQTSTEHQTASLAPSAQLSKRAEREERDLQRELEAYGVLSNTLRQEVYLRTYTEVMLPCLEGILGVKRAAPLRALSVKFSSPSYAHTA